MSSYPADIELWKAMKGLYSADLSVRKSGGILIVISCPEVVSTTHKGQVDLPAYSSKKLEENIGQKEGEDVTAAVSLAFSVAKTGELYRLCLCSNDISFKDTKKLHFDRFADPQEAPGFVDKKLGRNSKKLVFTRGGESFLILKSIDRSWMKKHYAQR